MNEKDPELLTHYLKFCRIRKKSYEEKVIDLANLTWIWPTTLLPLGIHIKENCDNLKYISPSNSDINSYISLMLNGSVYSNNSSTYLPLESLPRLYSDVDKSLSKIFTFLDGGKLIGGANSMKYLFDELTCNIYEHSVFKNAFAIAQQYPKKKYTIISLLDDGITIGGSVRKCKHTLGDLECLNEAINGFSTKSDERGYGLRTNIRLCTEGQGGDFFIVSGNAAIHVNSSNQNTYVLNNQSKLDGTLISIKIPHRHDNIDIYNYIE